MDDDEFCYAVLDESERSPFAAVSGVDSGASNTFYEQGGPRSGGFRTFVTTRSSTTATKTRSGAARAGRAGGPSREDYWQRNQPVLEKFDWSNTTIQIPIVAPHTETKQIKKQIHIATTTKIRNSRATWQDKCDMLASRFATSVPMASTESNTATTDIMSFTSDCYRFEDPQFADRNGNAIEAPGNNQQFLDATRIAARYLKFTIVCTPRDINTNTDRVDADELQRAAHATVYLRVILRGNRMNPCMTRNVCMDNPKLLIDLYETRNQPFDLLIKGRGDPDATLFRTWLNNVRFETKFEALAQITKKEYVGKMEGMETITQRLQQIKQAYWDHPSQKQKVSTVQELHEQFQSILSELDGTDPDAGSDIPSLAHLFHAALYNKLKDRVTDHLPEQIHTTFRENLNLYTEFKERASKAEKEIKGIINLVRPQTQMAARRPTYPAYPMTTQRSFYTSGYKTDEADDTQCYRVDAHEDDDSDLEDTPITIPPLTMFANKQERTYVKQLLTCLSVAETALREASGTAVPLKCWGCQGVREYQDDCYHMWAQCERKTDPRVIKSFQENLNKFREQQRLRRGTRHWKNNGYPTQHLAKQIQAIANPNTPPNARKVLIASLNPSISAITPRSSKRVHYEDQDPALYDQTDEDDETNPLYDDEPDRKMPAKKKHRPQTLAAMSPQFNRKNSGKPKRKGRAFLQYFNGNTNRHDQEGNPQRHKMAFLGSERKAKFDFAISDKLPFMEMLIGTGHEDEDDTVHTLQGLLDSGGCCNMGWLPYHQRVRDKFGHLVHKFFKLAEEQFEDINIGGIKDGVWITHIIEYWIPFQDNHGQATIKIGLTEDLPIATLFGLPFQIKANIKPDWNNQSATSSVFKTTFRIRMQHPERPPLTRLDYTDGTSKVLATRPTNEEYNTLLANIPRIGQARLWHAEDHEELPTEQSHKTFAASSATEAEERLARDGTHPDGTKQVACPKRAWRPKVKYRYKEVDLELDPNDDMDWLFERHGKCAIKHKRELPPRTDIELYNDSQHGASLEANLQWRDCPPEHRHVIRKIIQDHWDVFNPENMANQIRGYEFTIDTGNSEPVKCPTPRYGPHESRVINKLVLELENKGLIEDDAGPYAALVVLASKPNQGHVHWTKYVFRLCVSYRPLNAVTRGFEYPVQRCDDAVTDVGPRTHVCTGDLKAGYWQVKMHKDSKEKTGFYVPDGKKHWNVMPMGARNAHAFFVAMTEELRKRWTKQYGEHGRDMVAYVIHLYKTTTPAEFQDKIAKLKQTHPDIEYAAGKPMSVAIVDDLLWAAYTVISLLAFFKQSLETFQHYNVTFNLKKCRFLPARAEFVGVDVLAQGNAPAESKHEAITNLQPPILFSDLLLFIGLLGFYAKWIPWYEVRIKRWRQYLKQRPIIQDDKTEEARILASLWQPEDTAIFNTLKQEILDGPVLRRPDYNRRFYLKTDWSSEGIGGALTQPECDPNVEQAMQREMEGGPCELEKSIGGLRLRPIEFAARTCKGNERDMHSAVGEALAGKFLFNKYKRYLWYKEFTWITDCKANETFFEQDLMPTHVQQRWKLDMLRFPFTCVHRPEKMMYESNLLSRYNLWAEKHKRDAAAKQAAEAGAKRTQNQEQTQNHKNASAMTKAFLAYVEQQSEIHPLPHSNVIPQVVGQGNNRTFLADLCDKHRATWVIGDGAELITQAGKEWRADITKTLRIEDTEYWQDRTCTVTLAEAVKRLDLGDTTDCDWVFITRANTALPIETVRHTSLYKHARRNGAKALVVMWPNRTKTQCREETAVWENIIKSTNHNDTDDWTIWRWETENTKQGGFLEQTTTVLFAGPAEVINGIQCLDDSGDRAQLTDILDPPNSNYDGYFSYSRPVAPPTVATPQTDSAHIKFKVSISRQGRESVHPVFNIDRPGPNLGRTSYHVGEAPFLVETRDGLLPNTGKPFRKRETLRAMGYSEDTITSLVDNHEWQEVSTRLRRTVPKETCAAILLTLQNAEDRARDAETERLANDQPQFSGYLGIHRTRTDEDMEDQEAFLTAVMTRSQRPIPDDRVEEIHALEKELDKRGTSRIQEVVVNIQDEDNENGNSQKGQQALSKIINRWTTIPIPTDDKWREEIAKDPDLAYIKGQLENKQPLQYPQLQSKKYFDAWKNNQLELHDGILYQFEEPKLKRIRQLRRRIVPKGLRHHILIAYHSTPLAGHVGAYKTYWRIAARYWWPGMYTYVRHMVTSCGHCVVGNTVSHKAQQILQALSTDEPFDIIAIDIWHPGITTKMGSDSVKDILEQLSYATITSVCTTTGYATTANVNKLNAENVTQTIFAQIFVPNGIPKLILIDQDSVFKGLLVQFCELLGVRYHVCAPEAHDAILCERFHRFLNSVMRLIGADVQDLQHTISNVALATYAWNASTIDGTPVVRSFAAKARTFRFPVEVEEEDNVIRIPASPGEAALNHIETHFPLWKQQLEILKLLQKERREYHLEMKNANRKQRQFNPGDLVVVRKQVKSNAAEGLPEKLALKSRGPYRVLDKAGTDTYWIQRLPATQDVKRRKGKKHKESASRMTRIPSSIVVYKRMDSSDARFINNKQDFINNPLEHNLGIFDFGWYHTANPTKNHAFEPVEALWQEEVDNGSDEDESESEEEEDPTIERDTPRINNRIDNIVGERKRRRRRMHVRFADETDDDEEPQIVHINITTVRTEKQKRAKLWRAIERSKDKLCFIRRHEPGKTLGEWHLVQIDPDDTNERDAKTKGEYHVRYYIRHDDDARKLKVRQCKHWPLLREYYPGGYLGPILQMRPSKVDGYLQKHQNSAIWYQDTINLPELLIWGPFDFAPGNTYKVPEQEWHELQRRAEHRQVDVSNVNRREPLPTYNPRKRKRRT